MNNLEQFKEDMAMKLFGRSRTLSIAGNQCVKCGGSVVLRKETDTSLVACKDGGLDFRDELSEKEYGISGLCQTCQDGIFETGE